jgi:hypothetical protein
MGKQTMKKAAIDWSYVYRSRDEQSRVLVLCFFVPVAFDLGHSLSEGFQYGFDTFVPSLVFGVALLLIVLVEIGILIGTPIGKKIEQRLQH